MSLFILDKLIEQNYFYYYLMNISKLDTMIQIFYYLTFYPASKLKIFLIIFNQM